MPKIPFTSNAGYTRLVDERVAAHLVKKGRGTYETRDMQAVQPQPKLIPVPTPTTTEPKLVGVPTHQNPDRPVDSQTAPSTTGVEVNPAEPADVDPAAVTFPEAEKPAPVTGNSGKPLSAKERREQARAAAAGKK